jgi:hypothetical protein
MPVDDSPLRSRNKMPAYAAVSVTYVAILYYHQAVIGYWLGATKKIPKTRNVTTLLHKISLYGLTRTSHEH